MLRSSASQVSGAQLPHWPPRVTWPRSLRRTTEVDAWVCEYSGELDWGRDLGERMLTDVLSTQVELVLLYRTDLGVWYCCPHRTKERRLLLEIAAVHPAWIPDYQYCWSVAVALSFSYRRDADSAIPSAMYWMPESPRWIYSRGDTQRARRILADLHSRDRDINSPLIAFEIEEIEESISLDGADKRWWDFRRLVNTAPNRYRLGLCFMVSVYGQLSGNGLITCKHVRTLQHRSEPLLISIL